MLGTCLDQVRTFVPLVHNITNYVTVNDVANILLACGGSPIMSDEPEDVADKATQLQHVLRLYLTGLGDLDRVLTEVGQAQIAQQPTAVGVGIGAHATGPFGRELLELRH